MKKKLNIEEEIKKTLDSVDAIKRVEGNPFLYTRLQEKMKSSNQSNKRLVPVWQFAIVAALLLINGYVLFQSSNLENPTSSVSTIDDFAVEYELASSETAELNYYNLNEEN